MFLRRNDLLISVRFHVYSEPEGNRSSHVESTNAQRAIQQPQVTSVFDYARSNTPASPERPRRPSSGCSNVTSTSRPFDSEIRPFASTRQRPDDFKNAQTNETRQFGGQPLSKPPGLNSKLFQSRLQSSSMAHSAPVYNSPFLKHLFTTPVNKMSIVCPYTLSGHPWKAGGGCGREQICIVSCRPIRAVCSSECHTLIL